MPEYGVILVEDEDHTRERLARVIAGHPQLRLLGTGASCDEGRALLSRLSVDVLITDLGLPDGSGVDLIREARDRNPAMLALVITVFGDESHVIAAIEAGAMGYLLKDAPREELFTAVRTVAQGKAVFAPTVATRMLHQVRKPSRETLSARELEVLILVARGASNKEIARALHLSEATVKSHLLHLFAKLAVSDRTAAVTAALERGVLHLDT